MYVKTKRPAIATNPCATEVDEVNVEEMILPIATVIAKS